MKSVLLEKLSPEAQEQIYNTLYETLCKTIITLIQDSLEDTGLMKEEIQSAREFAEVKPDTDAARELLEFLDSDEVRKAVERVIDTDI